MKAEIGMSSVKFRDVRHGDEQLIYSPIKYWPNNPGALVSFGNIKNSGCICAYSTAKTSYPSYIYNSVTPNFMYNQGVRGNTAPYSLTFNKFFNAARNRTSQFFISPNSLSQLGGPDGTGYILMDIEKQAIDESIGCSWEKDITELPFYNSLPNGNYTLKVKLIDAIHSAGQTSPGVAFSKLPFYNINANLVGVSSYKDNKNKIMQNSIMTLIYIAETDYELPDTVQVTNAESTWNSTTGILEISNPTNTVNIIVNGDYCIKSTLVNVTAASSNPIKISQGATETLTFTANSGYSLPSDIIVSGATYTWNNLTGTLVLSNPTSKVLISITGESA